MDSSENSTVVSVKTFILFLSPSFPSEVVSPPPRLRVNAALHFRLVLMGCLCSLAQSLLRLFHVRPHQDTQLRFATSGKPFPIAGAHEPALPVFLMIT